MKIIEETSSIDGIEATCAALDVCRATFYRRRRPPVFGPVRRARPKRALSLEERALVLEVLHQDRFADLPPAQVHAALLDEGRYLCSERTMYRILETSDEVRERRSQLMHPRYAAPELLARGPNQLWSWDIVRHEAPWTAP